MNKGNVVYNEVLAMLERMPSYYYYKLPSDLIIGLKNNALENYNVVIEDDKHYNISRNAYLIFIKIYRDYIANKEDIEKLDQLLKLNDKIRQEEYENIFKSRFQKFNISYKENELESSNITIVSEKNLIKKIINKIKSIILKYK